MCVHVFACVLAVLELDTWWSAWLLQVTEASLRGIFFGVFDGHGGSGASLMVADQLINHLQVSSMLPIVSTMLCSTHACLFVGWLLNVPATGECISGTDLLKQLYVLPHWDRNCRSNVLPHLVTVYWHRADQSQCWSYNARRLAG